MPTAAAELYELLDAGRPGAEVIERAQPAFDRAEAEGDEQAEAELYRVVDRAWRASQHLDHLDELAAIRQLFRAEPGRVVAAVVEAATVRRRPRLPLAREAPYWALWRAAMLTASVEAWSGSRKAGTPGALARL